MLVADELEQGWQTCESEYKENSGQGNFLLWPQLPTTVPTSQFLVPQTPKFNNSHSRLPFFGPYLIFFFYRAFCCPILHDALRCYHCYELSSVNSVLWQLLCTSIWSLDFGLFSPQFITAGLIFLEYHFHDATTPIQKSLMIAIHHLLKRFKFLSFVPTALSDQVPSNLSSLLLSRTPEQNLLVLTTQMYSCPPKSPYVFVSSNLFLLMWSKYSNFSKSLFLTSKLQFCKTPLL